MMLGGEAVTVNLPLIGRTIWRGYNEVTTRLLLKGDAVTVKLSP